MDKIKVNLLNITGLEAAHLAVQKPYGKKVKDPAELFHKVAKLYKHRSIMEHIIFQFEIDGSSRLELQEHMRHRMASPTVCSTRYSMKKFVKEYIEIKKDVSWTKVLNFVKKYTVFTENMNNELFENWKDPSLSIGRVNARYDLFDFFVGTYLEFGADEAKYELPESIRTSFVWTINMRSMLNFLELRRANNAHFEIRHIANMMYNLLCENEEIKNLLE